MFPLLLASASPRRSAILRALGAAHRVLAVSAPEPRTDDPVESALLAARAKHAAARARPEADGAAVLAADTLVACGGRVIGKPRGEEDAVATLLFLAGRTHHVFTAVALSEPGTEPDVFVEASAVRFRAFGEEEARAYFRLARTGDRAGAYDIDAHGERLVASLAGSFTNVMGLPAEPVAAWLRAHGHPCAARPDLPAPAVPLPCEPPPSPSPT